MNHISPIETTRLMLLPGQNSRDNSAFLQMLMDDGDFRQFSGVDCSEQNLLCFDNYMERDFLYAIYRKEDLTELLGYIGLGQRNGGHYEIEFYIKRPERRKGYCTEALRPLCKAAFAGKLTAKNKGGKGERLVLDKIYAIVTAENISAKKLLEKNGFLQPGTGAIPVLMAYIDPETNAMYANSVVEYVLEKPQTGGW